MGARLYKRVISKTVEGWAVLTLTLSAPVAYTLPSGNGGTLTLQAGRSILLNTNIIAALHLIGVLYNSPSKLRWELPLSIAFWPQQVSSQKAVADM